MRLNRATLLGVLLAACCPVLRAEYVVMRNGQRLSVTGYEQMGQKYRLQMPGGFVDVLAVDVVSIEPEEIFVRVAVRPAVGAKPLFRDLVEASGAHYHVDADLISSVIAAESNFNAKAISRRNARGLMQLLPKTAARLGVRNIFDPRENIEAGTRYLGELLERYQNDLTLTLAAYNAGPERVRQYGRVPHYAETVSYVRRVKRLYEKRKADARADAPRNSTPAVPVVLESSNASGDSFQ